MTKLPASLPFKNWPEMDRLAWQDIFADGDIFDGQGLAVSWRPATRKTNLRHYGRWLFHVAGSSNFKDSDTPAHRVTPELVSDYVIALKSRLASVSVHGAVVGLKSVITAMAPDHDWRWLARVCGRLKRFAEPETDKRPRMRPIEQIYGAAIAELGRLTNLGGTTSTDLRSYRTAIMIALLAARPIRLKNLASMALGKHLFRRNDGWCLHFEAAEVKNRQPLDFDLPQSLVPYLEHYLDQIRPRFSPRTHDAVWISNRRGPLSEIQCYVQIIAGTKRLVGGGINPHLFRDCAATSLAMNSTSNAFAAAALLGHRDFSTTERHYIRALQLESSGKITRLLEAVRHERLPR